jgi:hypothetical protein
MKIFREYLAHNKKFIAIFDADLGGKRAKERYIREFSRTRNKYLPLMILMQI